MKNEKLVVSASVPAKINLCLNVKFRRDDGYHHLESIMQSVSLYDVVTLSLHEDEVVNISCDTMILPDDNTVIRAYNAFKKYAMNRGVVLQGADIHIEKNIPVMAGMGGGSCDAAGVLTILNFMFSKLFTLDELKKIGLEVGMDVPFCLMTGTGLLIGPGGDVRQLPLIPDCCIVIAKPKAGLSTKTIFKNYNLNNNTRVINIELAAKAIEQGDYDDLVKQCINVLTPVAVEQCSEIGDIIKIMQQSGAMTAEMSGTGSAVFGLFYNENIAKRCIHALREKYNDVFPAKPVDKIILEVN